MHRTHTHAAHALAPDLSCTPHTPHMHHTHTHTQRMHLPLSCTRRCARAPPGLLPLSPSGPGCPWVTHLSAWPGIPQTCSCWQGQRMAHSRCCHCSQGTADGQLLPADGVTRLLLLLPDGVTRLLLPDGMTRLLPLLPDSVTSNQAATACYCW